MWIINIFTLKVKMMADNIHYLSLDVLLFSERKETAKKISRKIVPWLRRKRRRRRRCIHKWSANFRSRNVDLEDRSR